MSFNEGADGLVVEVLDVHPLDALAEVLLLLTLQHQLNEQLLQLLIAVVDAELLETEDARTHARTHTHAHTLKFNSTQNGEHLAII